MAEGVVEAEARSAKASISLPPFSLPLRLSSALRAAEPDFFAAFAGAAFDAAEEGALAAAAAAVGFAVVVVVEGGAVVTLFLPSSSAFGFSAGVVEAVAGVLEAELVVVVVALGNDGNFSSE